MKQFDPLTIQKNIEEKRLILGGKVEFFLLQKLSVVSDFFARVFAAKNSALFGSIAIFLISILVRSTRDIGQDSALYLEVAQKILNGGKYYYDFFENNLPLSFIFTLIPLGLAKVFAVNPIICTEVFVNLIGIAAIYSAAKILKRTEISKDHVVYNLVILSFSAGFFLRIFTLQFNEFATKSTYFLAFSYPYICYQFFKSAELKKSDQIVIGLLAGLLICLKPHYGILVLALEIRRFWLEKATAKIVFELRNLLILAIILFYTALIFLFFPEYIKAIPSFATLYFNPKFFYPIFPLKEDIYPLLLLIIPCFFLRKKFPFLRLFFFISLVFCPIVVSELTGVYDQRVLLYSLSLPLVSLIILALIRDHQINWRRDFITLLLILLIPQFDHSFFVTTAFNICAFWWIIVFAMSQKWNKQILSEQNWRQLNFLRHVFLPREPLSWFCFAVLTAITIKMSATRTANNLAWGLSALIFVLQTYFYHNLHRNLISDKKFSLLSASLIFVVLSYFVSLQSAAIFNIHEYKSPNFVNDKIFMIAKENLHDDENFIMVSGRILANYPVRNYLQKINPLPASQMQNFYFTIEERETADMVQNYLLPKLKEQMRNPKNKLLFIEPRGLPFAKGCRIMFLEYYLRDAEFRKIFLENYVFLDRVIATKEGERKVKFFSDKQVKSYSINPGETVIRDAEVYVRK